jgi:RNA polymerase sigma factor (sigma-70 family)
MTDHDITTLYAKHSARLKRYVSVRVGSAQEAEDVVQSVFLEVCKGDALPKINGSVEAYLLGVAGHFTARHIRQKQKDRRAAHREPFRRCPTATEPGRSPDEVDKIRLLLEQLPAKAREALKLKFIEGMTAKEAGARLGCSEHTFCQRVHCAIRALRALARPNGRPKARQGENPIDAGDPEKCRK